MAGWIIEEIVVIPVIGAIVIAVIWQVSALLQAKAGRNRDHDYQVLAERAVSTQQATESKLAEVVGELGEAVRQISEMHRILKQAE